MATVTATNGQPVSEEEQVRVLIELGMSPIDARFVVGLGAGGLTGDVVRIDAAGHIMPDEEPDEGPFHADN